MKKKFSIKKNHQFKYIFSKGKNQSGKILKILYTENKLKNNRIGLCVSKNIETVPLKNKCKRLMRESFRQITLKQGYDIVLVWRSNDSNHTYHEVLEDMKMIFKKLDLLNEENND